jgi:hypothetical protein
MSDMNIEIKQRSAVPTIRMRNSPSINYNIWIYQDVEDSDFIEAELEREQKGIFRCLKNMQI